MILCIEQTQYEFNAKANKGGSTQSLEDKSVEAEKRKFTDRFTNVRIH